MTDPKQPAELADDALADVTAGFYSMAGGGSELARRRNADDLMSFGNDATTVVDDDPQSESLVSFGAETTP